MRDEKKRRHGGSTIHEFSSALPLLKSCEYESSKTLTWTNPKSQESNNIVGFIYWKSKLLKTIIFLMYEVSLRFYPNRSWSNRHEILIMFIIKWLISQWDHLLLDSNLRIYTPYIGRMYFVQIEFSIDGLYYRVSLL